MLTKKDLKNITLNESVIAKPDFKTRFIKNWESAKIGLAMIALATKNPLISISCKFLIAFGDELYKRLTTEK